MYRCEVSSEEQLIKKLARDLVPYGYFFYSTFTVPEHKDAAPIDEKIVKKYRITESRYTRSRQRKEGNANVQYKRHGAFGVLIATLGTHPFFEAEGNIKDIREKPLRVGNYTISYRAKQGEVRLVNYEYERLRLKLLDYALHRKADALEEMLRGVSTLNYEGVRKQKLRLLRAVNTMRKKAGFRLLSPERIAA